MMNIYLRMIFRIVLVYFGTKINLKICFLFSLSILGNHKLDPFNVKKEIFIT